jgi:hypothetical protein
MDQGANMSQGSRSKGRFTKISADGKKLKADAKTWVAVLDNTTGLMWDVGETAAMNWADAKAHCKKLRTAGFKDWRLPPVKEWETVIDRLRTNPCIDTRAFPNCRSDWYWAADVDVAFPSGCAWGVDLLYGGVDRGNQAAHDSVRAVRAGQPSDFGVRAKKSTRKVRSAAST